MDHDLLLSKYEIILTTDTYKIVVGSVGEARKLISSHYKQLALSAAKLGKKETCIFYARDRKPLRVLASQENSQQENNQIGAKKMQISSNVISEHIFISPEITVFSKPLVDVLGIMIDADRPMGLTRLSDNRQLWINQKMADMLRSDPTEAVKRKMSDYWLPEDLYNLEQRIRLEGSAGFQHNYQAALNSHLWAKLVANFVVVEDKYRLATNLAHEIISRPINA